MSLASRLPNGVRRLFRLPRSRARLLRELDDEVQFHLEMRIAELRQLGMNETEARAEAARRFGDTQEFHAYAARRAARQARWHAALDWLAAWLQDIRFAARLFRKTPGFTAITVLTLALGIGANAAIFTVVHRLLLAPLPYQDGNRIVMLIQGEGERPDVATLRLWRARAHSLETIAAVSIDAILVESGEEQDTVHAFITPNYLQLLGVHPALGRAFTLQEAAPGAAAVAMISYGLWQRGYGGRADVLGRSVPVDGRPYTIVGVAPPDLALPMSPATARMKLREAVPGIWLPASLDAMHGDDRPDAYARLRPGVSAREASRELAAIVDSVPGALQERARPRAMRAQDFLDAREAQTVEVLFAAVGVLLLIACANVANLLMARAWTRRRELAVRVALGAGRGRLARQVLTESVLLALAGGALGVAVAWQALRLIIALRPPALDNLAGVHLAMPVLLWTAGLSVVTGMLFGCAPALFAGARAVGDVLRSESRAGSGGTASRRMRAALIVFEIAMSLVLLAGAGLLVRSWIGLQAMPLGFEPRGLAEVEVLFHLPPTSANREARAAALRQAILARLRGIPGVVDAAVGTLPGDAYFAMAPLATEADATGGVRSVPAFSPTFMSPNYLRIARMSLVAGRLPDSAAWAAALDRAPVTPEEVVVNRGLARRLWPDGGAIGARLHSGLRRGETYTVVGIVDDIDMPGPRAAIKSAQLYLLPRVAAQTFLVRAAPSAAAIVPVLRRVVAGVDPAIIVRTVTVGESYLADALAPTRFAMALLAAFSGIALLLSAIGLYGVIAYAVSQRTREIGIRVALGAEPAAVARLVVGGGVRLVAAGILLGVMAAAASTRVLGSLLYGVSPADPVTFLVIAALLVAIALLASYVPARRALRIDPTQALRAD